MVKVFYQPMRKINYITITNCLFNKTNQIAEICKTSFATFYKPAHSSINNTFLQAKKILYLSDWILRSQNGCNKVVNELRVMHLWFQVKLVLRTRLILKSCIWFQTKLDSTQFNNHYIFTLIYLSLSGIVWTYFLSSYQKVWVHSWWEQWLHRYHRNWPWFYSLDSFLMKLVTVS